MYWDEGEVCYYYLGVDVCKVSAIIERITVDWAVASELPRVCGLLRIWGDGLMFVRHRPRGS